MLLFKGVEPLIGSASIQYANEKDWDQRQKCLYKTFKGEELKGYFPKFVSIAQVSSSEPLVTASLLLISTQYFEFEKAFDVGTELYATTKCHRNIPINYVEQKSYLQFTGSASMVVQKVQWSTNSAYVRVYITGQFTRHTCLPHGRPFTARNGS